MDKTETQRYAELINNMSTDYLLGKISEEHYKNNLDMVVKQLNIPVVVGQSKQLKIENNFCYKKDVGLCTCFGSCNKPVGSF